MGRRRAVDELLPDEMTWVPDERIELRDWLLPAVEAVAEQYGRYTGAEVHRVELVLVDGRGDTKQLNFVLKQQLAD
jgi:hypothetical protein